MGTRQGLADPRQPDNRPRPPGKGGGARRDRTVDLLHAMQALSQLSYGPVRREIIHTKPPSSKPFPVSSALSPRIVWTTHHRQISGLTAILYICIVLRRSTTLSEALERDGSSLRNCGAWSPATAASVIMRTLFRIPNRLLHGDRQHQ